MTTIEISGSAPRMMQREVASFVRKVLLAAGEDIGEMSIAFVDDAMMRTLNRKFRGKNKTTDVLTFPGENAFEIVISIDQARRQARNEKHSVPTELRYLLLHGILHGLGYDHESDDGEMNALEIAVREKVGLD
ncbi:MAG TPA: rRNA maturation RNase YbeY [Thermoanaerobaculia bacterium]|nr:rRNA maturation RNase YbeY [Thermoanaerobaculia bacterium]